MPISGWEISEGRQAAALLLDWFSRQARALPWRQDRTPYRVWLSEIMLQQTQVQTVIPYYDKFLQAWPSFQKLAAASAEQVLKSWEGLGYYARARHLHETAGIVSRDFGGMLPADEESLAKLPGIGEYTACAILSIAFGIPAASVDGNVVRVFSRLSAVGYRPGDIADRRIIRRLAESLMPAGKAGDWNEALMDLGATICLPRQPLCAACPLQLLCRAYRDGRTGDFPISPDKKSRPSHNRVALAVARDGQVLVRRRPPTGLLAGLYEFCWLDGIEPFVPGSIEKAVAGALPGAVISPLGSIVHDFTHLRWRLTGVLAVLPANEPAVLPAVTQDKQPTTTPTEGFALLRDFGGRWVKAEDLAALPFPRALDAFRASVIERVAAARREAGEAL